MLQPCLNARIAIVGARLPAKTSAHRTSSSPDTAFASKPAPTGSVNTFQAEVGSTEFTQFPGVQSLPAECDPYECTQSTVGAGLLANAPAQTLQQSTSNPVRESAEMWCRQYGRKGISGK